MANNPGERWEDYQPVADCVHRFENGPDATAQLAALKKAERYQRSDLIEKTGWATMPGTSRGRRCAYLRSAARESSLLAPRE